MLIHCEFIINHQFEFTPIDLIQTAILKAGLLWDQVIDEQILFISQQP